VVGKLAVLELEEMKDFLTCAASDQQAAVFRKSEAIKSFVDCDL
jgi:hypothetical protein